VAGHLNVGFPKEDIVDDDEAIAIARQYLRVAEDLWVQGNQLAVLDLDQHFGVPQAHLEIGCVFHCAKPVEPLSLLKSVHAVIVSSRREIEGHGLRTERPDPGIEPHDNSSARLQAALQLHQMRAASRSIVSFLELPTLLNIPRDRMRFPVHFHAIHLDSLVILNIILLFL
jgi:hypothetical protein